MSAAELEFSPGPFDRWKGTVRQLWRLRTFADLGKAFDDKLPATTVDLEGTCLSVATTRGDILISLDDELFIDVTDGRGQTIHSEVIEREKDLRGGVEALRDRLLAMLDGLEEAA